MIASQHRIRRLPHKALQVPVIKLADQSSGASDKGYALAGLGPACSLFSTFHHVDISLPLAPLVQGPCLLRHKVVLCGSAPMSLNPHVELGAHTEVENRAQQAEAGLVRI